MSFSELYFSAKGRVGRKTYWLKLIVPVIIISVVLIFIDVALGTEYAIDPNQPESGVGLFSGIFSLLTLVPSIMMGIKRFHDRDKTGWWLLIGIIPIVGAIWLLVELGFLRGTDGPNRFGPPEGEMGGVAYQPDAAL